MAALVGVGPRTAPVLLEEHPQPLLGGVELVLRVNRSQNLVFADQRIELRHDRVERLSPSDGIVKRLLGCRIHPLHCGACGVVTRCSSTDLRTRSVLSCTMTLFMVD